MDVFGSYSGPCIPNLYWLLRAASPEAQSSLHYSIVCLVRSRHRDSSSQSSEEEESRYRIRRRPQKEAGLFKPSLRGCFCISTALTATQKRAADGFISSRRFKDCCFLCVCVCVLRPHDKVLAAESGSFARNE